MATPVIMPRQGISVETCIITEWYKQKGDRVEVGDVLFSYETDKASFEEEAQEAGVLLEIFYEADEEVPVLTPVAVIGEPGEDYSELLPENMQTDPAQVAETAPAEAAEPAAETAEAAPVPAAAPQTGRLKISPRAKIWLLSSISMPATQYRPDQKAESLSGISAR